MTESFVSSLTKIFLGAMILVWLIAGYLFLDLQQEKAKLKEQKVSSSLNTSPSLQIKQNKISSLEGEIENKRGGLVRLINTDDQTTSFADYFLSQELLVFKIASTEKQKAKESCLNNKVEPQGKTAISSESIDIPDKVVFCLESEQVKIVYVLQ